MKSLAETLAYDNANLLIKFREFYDFSGSDSLFIFEQLKKWLWVKALHGHQRRADPFNATLQFHFHVMPAMRIVDELWHVFLLFSRDYRDFCQTYFADWVDHQPSLPHERPDPAQLNREFERELYFIGEKLGPEVLQLWFNELPKRFPESLINARYVYRESRLQ